MRGHGRSRTVEGSHRRGNDSVAYGSGRNRRKRTPECKKVPGFVTISQRTGKSGTYHDSMQHRTERQGQPTDRTRRDPQQKLTHPTWPQSHHIAHYQGGAQSCTLDSHYPALTTIQASQPPPRAHRNAPSTRITPVSDLPSKPNRRRGSNFVYPRSQIPSLNLHSIITTVTEGALGCTPEANRRLPRLRRGRTHHQGCTSPPHRPRSPYGNIHQTGWLPPKAHMPCLMMSKTKPFRDLPVHPVGSARSHSHAWYPKGNLYA